MARSDRGLFGRARAAAAIDALFGVDLRALAALRVGLASLVLVDLALRARDLRAHYADDGVLPRELSAEIHVTWAPSLHALDGGVGFAAALFALHALVAAAMLAGAWSRASTIATWLLTVSLHARNPLVEQGADDLLRLLLFWSCFLPLGVRFAVDARRPAARRPPTGRGRVVSVASAGLLLQIAGVYAVTCLHKSGAAWRDGTAVALALRHDHFGRPWAQRILLPHADLLRWLSHAVLVIEGAAPFLLFSPAWTGRARGAALVALLALQIGFGATMNVAHFPWVSAVALVPFVPSPLWDALEARVTRGAGRREPEPAGRGDPARSAWRWLGDALAAAAIAYVLAWNIGNFSGDVERPIGAASAVGAALGLDQQWTMFAPEPAIDSGWFVFPGQLADGTEVDVFPTLSRPAGEQPVAWERPAHVFGSFRNTRWLDYLMELHERDDERLWSRVSSWLCGAWNASHPAGRRLDALTIHYVLAPSDGPPRRAEADEPQWSGACP